MYQTEEIVRELNQFKMDALLRLNTLEMKVAELDNEDQEIKKDIEELKQAVIKETDQLNEKVEFIKSEMPSATTNKIMFSIFGATVSFLFALVLLFFR